MRGIEFQNQEAYGKILDDLFRGIPFEKYDWYIYEDEIHGDSLCKELPQKVNGEQFQQAIRDSEYMVNFINVQVYPKGAKISKLEVYEDFVNSECEIVFLIADVYYMDIYVKDKELLSIFIENAKRCNSENIIIKTDDNDDRTALSVI